MHEMSIAESLLQSCLECLEPRDAARIESVRIVVGELAAVEPELLRYAWEAVTMGTPDEGARLEIEYVAVQQICESCGPIEDRQPGTWMRTCPSCAAPLLLSGGDELDILGLSLETELQGHEV